MELLCVRVLTEMDPAQDRDPQGVRAQTAKLSYRKGVPPIGNLQPDASVVDVAACPGRWLGDCTSTLTPMEVLPRCLNGRKDLERSCARTLVWLIQVQEESFEWDDCRDSYRCSTIISTRLEVTSLALQSHGPHPCPYIDL